MWSSTVSRRLGVSGIWSVDFLVSLLAGTLRISTPILIPALGEIYTQRSGILNLGVEGLMIMGALCGFMGAFFSGSLWFGLFCAVLGGAVFSLIMGFLSITVGANQVIAGTALTILGTGFASFIYREAFGIRKLPPIVETFQSIRFPILSDIPVIGPILFSHNILVYLGWILVFVTWIVLEKTVFGLKVKAVGEYPKAADAKGIRVALIRYACVVIGGMYAGLGGAFMTLGFMDTYMDHMIAGRGFIAVSVVIFARWDPRRALWAALLFGGANALQMRLQAMGMGVPPQFLLALPYVLTIIVLVLVSKKVAFPSAFTVPYFRGDK